ncbi:sigma-70 family RNA polymerase sigma factor [Bacteroides xylanisolvens]|uniref:sigma-70 family RNA polymerase sigma factor n=1 Tax=Bacteroides xylanisolvens TaxID=371601 RepID=UPI001DB73788|nr:sigma-70 family RNA polymerase sigma factor [Bacteroides xylanisolvens]MBT9859721.1 sigma-70 family RNA polymerase sigma factor [Bacteroides xylanisolvens]
MEEKDMQTMNPTTNQLLTETYNSLCPIIIHYINRKINDYESARDMAQDVFLRLMEYKQILRKETVRSMVFFIAHNLVIDYLRRYYRKQEMSAYFYEYGVTVTDETESSVIANDLSAQENLKLLQLSPQRRTVYIMSRFQEKTTPKISEELCLSRRTVENHLLAGRKEIREYIKLCI